MSARIPLSVRTGSRSRRELLAIVAVALLTGCGSGVSFEVGEAKYFALSKQMLDEVDKVKTKADAKSRAPRVKELLTERESIQLDAQIEKQSEATRQARAESWTRKNRDYLERKVKVLRRV
jgi:hypothetical protein